ncbi:Putative transcriptional regulator [gamma proteobacterium HdN1]|nr:Putative transcriptional regulator [gamma proteobacterium HdN1]
MTVNVALRYISLERGMQETERASLLYLWNLRTLYIGPLFEESANILPAASSLVIALDEDMLIRVRTHAQPIRTRVALIPAGVAFSAEARNRDVASLYLDPVGSDLARLRPRMTHQIGDIWYDCDQSAALIQMMRTIHASPPPPAQLALQIEEQIFPPIAAGSTPHPVDPRIWQVIDHVKTHPLDNTSSEVLAAHAGMTDAQLRKSFKQATGIPLRRYRRWHRLFITASLMACGKTLTEAALTAGFSDSSHFSHAFREMTGVKPSTMLRRKENLRIFTSSS